MNRAAATLVCLSLTGTGQAGRKGMLRGLLHHLSRFSASVSAQHKFPPPQGLRWQPFILPRSDFNRFPLYTAICCVTIKSKPLHRSHLCEKFVNCSREAPKVPSFLHISAPMGWSVVVGAGQGDPQRCLSLPSSH